MITWKLLGVLLLLSMGGLTSLNLSHYEKKRVSVLNGWMDLIFYIRTQIDCYLTPIEQIFSEASPSLIGACMGDRQTKDPSELLHHSKRYLTQECVDLLDAFSREIGCCYREEQVKRCDYYLAALKQLRDKQTTELPARLRSRSALCLCGAFGLAIILW